MYAVFLNKTAFHLTFSKKTWSRAWRLPILGLQPRDKAAMLGVNTIEMLLEEFMWK